MACGLEKIPFNPSVPRSARNKNPQTIALAGFTGLICKGNDRF